MGQDLKLLGHPEGLNPNGDEGRSTATEVPQHFRMDVDQKEREVTSPAPPNHKKARAGRNSQATGSTHASPDDLVVAKGTPLPQDSDDDQGGKG